MLVHCIYEFFMIDVASSDNDEVVSEEVSGVEVSEMVSFDEMHIVSVSLGWLAHHVFSVHIEVSVLKEGFLVSVMVVLMLLTDFFLSQFQLIGIQSTIRNQVSQDLHSLCSIILEHLKSE